MLSFSRSVSYFRATAQSSARLFALTLLKMLRLLLHRLEVLEAALLMLAEALDTAAAKPCGTSEKPT